MVGNHAGYLHDLSAGSLIAMQLRQASVDEQAVIRRWGRDGRNVATARVCCWRR